MTYRVALKGFTAFERSALAACLRLARRRLPAYETADDEHDSDFIVADADEAPTLATVQQLGRVHDTVFIGANVPEGAPAWMMRPIDPLHVLRELDAMVASRGGAPAPSATGAVMPPLPRTGPPSAFAPAPTPGRTAPPGGRRAEDLSASWPAPGGGRIGFVAAASPRHRAGAGGAPLALVVDDSEVAQRFLEARLQALGVRTERAATSAKAQEWLHRRPFDIAFVDIDLGDGSELDGLALCRHVKREFRPLPGAQVPVVVMHSAHAGELDRVRGMLAGCDAHLGKPVSEATLRDLLLRHGLLRSGVPRQPD
jgi:CheY-like chemotaxis protein